ncbi:MAG TPA: sucrase ferredoxin, partial [Candidatus Binatia bacterium]|nr:sucrase ferredoxin [Candidatus Binatia bacterium]
MTLQAPMRCSALAEEMDEPMIGSVEVRRRWLLLEDRSAWGADAVRDVFGPALAARAKELQLGLLLVRRREGDPAADAVRRAILVDAVRREMAIRSVASPAELSVEAAARSPVADFGAPMSAPIVLVCTNGKRDACCSLRGRALVGALAAEHAERVWECTHLGGHRFAGNLVCLPDGIVYGR